MNRATDILHYTIFAIIILAMALIAAIQTPRVQKLLTDKAISILEAKTDADVSLESIHFKSFNTLLLKGLAIVDRHPYAPDARDTLLYVNSLSVRFSLNSLAGPSHEDIILKEVILRDGQFNLVIEKGEYGNNLSRIFRLKPKAEPKPMPEKDILRIKKITMSGFTYTMRNFVSPMKQTYPHAINWSDMGVDDINLNAHDFRISHGLFYASVEHMDFCERTGWKVKELRAETVTGKGKATISNIHLEDEESIADFDYSMTGTSRQYLDYINQVVMEARIHKGRWSLKTLAHFIPPLNPDPGTVMNIEGHAIGTVSDLMADGIRIKAEGKRLSTTLSGRVSGLPDVRKMLIDASLSNTTLTTEAVSEVVNAIAPKAGLDLGDLGKGILYHGKIKAYGYLNRLSATIDINESRNGGNAKVSAKVKNILKPAPGPIEISGKVRTENFNLGKAMRYERLGKLTASSEISVTLPYNDDPIEIKADSLNIRSLHFNGYEYRGIEGYAAMEGDDITVDVQSRDKALDADITVWSDKYAYSGALLVRKADLRTMNIDRRGRSEVAVNAYTRLDKDLKNLQGNANLSGICLTNDDGAHRVADITLNVAKDDGDYDISLDSGAARGTFIGNTKHLKADFEVLDAATLLAFVKPGLYIEQGTSARFRIDTTEQISGNLSSGRLAYNNNYIKDLNATVSGTVSEPSGTVTSSQICAGRIELDNNVIVACKKDSTISIKYNFLNTNEAAARKFGNSDINAEVVLGRQNNYTVNILQSMLNADGKDWDIAPSVLCINGRDISVEGFSLVNNEHSINIDGGISEDNEDILSARIKNLNLKFLNEFTTNNMGIKGALDADAKIYSPISDGVKGVEIKLTGSNLAMAGQDFGNITVNSTFDDLEKMFNINATEIIDGTSVLMAEGTYKPGNQELNAEVDMTGFPIGFVHHLMPSVFSNTGGTLNGRLFARGPLKKLNLSSTGGHINDGLLQVAFTHVPYTVNGDFKMTDNGIYLQNATVKDRYKGTGTVSGGMKWNRMKNMALDLHMDVRDIEAIDIPKNNHELIAGNVFATGKVNLTGPLNTIVLDADATTTGNSTLYLSLSSTADASKGNLLTFTDPNAASADPYGEILKKYDRDLAGKASNFKMKFNFKATPAVDIFLNLGSGGFAAGINGTGNGDIAMVIDSNPATFNILGDYTITDGYFNVNASEIVSKTFTISDGSTIKFGGDIMSSTVDLDAIYQTKASIETLLAEKEAVSNRRPVNCGIHIQNRLSNPKIDFSIDVPDLSPAAKSQVESALSTEDKVQRQFLSLLLSNNFLPDEQSGVVNNSSLLYSNVSEMMANQVNNIFNKLNIPLDLGLNYRPSDKGTASLFDVALSTQLFNNRVIIGGTLGNKQNATTNNQSLFGNLDIQYKVTKSGALRLNVFSHAADQYTNALDDSQKNGIGVTWQQEFDRFPQWFKKLFSSKVQREVINGLEAEENRRTQTIMLNGN